MPAMLKDLDWQLSDVGILSTIFYIVYGSSRFLGGIISDKSNPRYFMGVGLIITGFINIAFGMSSSLPALALLWGLNAFFQGWGWPPCTKILTTWYSRNERGFWWAICNTSHNVGGAIIPLLAGWLAIHYGWRYGMIVPGIVGIVVGIILCIIPVSYTHLDVDKRQPGNKADFSILHGCASFPGTRPTAHTAPAVGQGPDRVHLQNRKR